MEGEALPLDLAPYYRKAVTYALGATICTVAELVLFTRQIKQSETPAVKTASFGKC